MKNHTASTAGRRLSDELLKSELNEAQLEAVNVLSGPLLILAGAGSGKTRVITYRIARLIDEGVSPGAIMSLTFTNKAAKEMRERTLDLLNVKYIDLWISTFHSACLRILRTHADKINYPKNFAVYDAQDQLRLIKTCLKELDIPEKIYPPRQIGSLISNFKNKLKGPDDAQNELTSRRHREFLACFHLYEKKLSEARCMDFDDLLGKAVSLFRHDDQLRESYQARYEHILVDEFQDTNVAQYELIRLLVGSRGNICVVGDDDQSIYQWRGANIGNILNFEKEYPSAKVILLERNYRSAGNILKGASAVVARNPDRKKKTLWTQNEPGEKIDLYTATDEMDEARNVADTIRENVNGGGYGLNDIAIFYRTNSQSRALEDTLRREGFAYQIYGGLKFYERKEVKDILSYFKVALNPLDTIALKRIINTPPRGIGQTTMERMETAAREEGVTLSAILDDIGAIKDINQRTRDKLSAFREIISQVRTFSATADSTDALSQAMEATGYMEWLTEDKKNESLSRMDNLSELVNASAEFAERTGDASMLSFLDQASLVADADRVEDGEGGGAVKMMTVHVSKGLEFPFVFVTGLEENLFPHARSKEDVNQLQEERRLLYVAMTRARERLFLSHAQSRRMLGVSQVNRPSNFLDDLPDEILNRRRSLYRSSYNAAYSAGAGGVGGTGKTSYKSKRSAWPEVKQESKSIDGLKVGMKVRHPNFQTGVIRKIEGAGDKGKITVYFPHFGAKKMIKKFAKLEVIK
ncbi:ATP-dependent DNA helicase UvrD/PcrA [hydrothermal vent metagenome]|uniref:DNA 3'-5' helicase n=1 Tax=hydrothermal vent metagenome TaxID=652676 RepID=A0A3B1CKR1_9ZZZZ